MKKAVKRFVFMAFCMVFALSAIGVSNGAASYALEPSDQITLYVGQTFELKSFMISQNTLTAGTPIWTSLYPQVASVSGTGLVTAIKPGETTVSAIVSSGTQIKEAKVKVTIKTAVQSVTISESTLRLVVGQEQVLQSTVTPIAGLAAPYVPGVNWKSQNELIAKVDSAGRVTGVAPGKTIVFVGTKDGDMRAYCDVEIYSMVTGISVEPLSMDLSLGETAQLTPKIMPDNAINKKVTYKTNNASVATVSDTGLVTSKGPGETQVYVTSVDGGKSYGIPVKVTSMVSGIQLDKGYLDLTNENSSAKLTAKVIPKDPNQVPKNAGVNWKSSNTSVVTVDATGMVKALKIGMAYITATTSDGGYEATCSVNSHVNAATTAATNTVLINDIQILSPPKQLYAGQAAEIAYKVYPENATTKTISVKGNPAFTAAPVVSSGSFIIKPTRAGIYVVTAYSDASTFTEFTVEVKPSIRSLRIEAPDLESGSNGTVVYLGQKAYFKVTPELSGIDEKDLAVKDVKWEFNSKDLKVEKDPANPYGAFVTLLKPMSTYLEASMLDGLVKQRINIAYEPMAKAMTMADQADINLNYTFKPIFELTPKDALRYGLTSVINKEYDLYVEEAYIDTEFLKTEIAYESEYLPELKKLADQLSEGSQRTAKLNEWGLHSLRKYQFQEMLKQPGSTYQKVLDLNQLTDRSLKKLSFFEVKDGGVSSLFAGKVLLKVVSRDGSLEKKIWVTSKAQAEDLILMDIKGTVLATSSDLAKQLLQQKEAEALRLEQEKIAEAARLELEKATEAKRLALAKEAEAKRVQLLALKAKFKLTKAAELPSDAYLQNVLDAVGLKLVTEVSYKGKYQKPATQLDLLTLLVKAYELESKKTAKKGATQYFTNVKSDVAEKAYVLGLISGNSKRAFNGTEAVTNKMMKDALAKWFKVTKTNLKYGLTIDKVLGTQTTCSKEELIRRIVLIMKGN